MVKTLDDDWGVANALNNLAIAALRSGDFDGALARQSETLRIWRRLENRAAVALSLQNLGNIERARGAHTVARERYSESADVFRDIGDTRGLAILLTHIADLDRDEGQFQSAIALYESALQTFIGLNDHWLVANCMADYGETCRRAAKRADAHSLLEESLMVFRELGDRKSGARVIESLALLECDEGKRVRALELAGAAAAVRSELGLPAGDVGPSISEARLAGGAEADAAWERGQRMKFDEAVDYAQTA